MRQDTLLLWLHTQVEIRPIHYKCNRGPLEGDLYSLSLPMELPNDTHVGHVHSSSDHVHTAWTVRFSTFCDLSVAIHLTAYGVSITRLSNSIEVLFAPIWASLDEKGSYSHQNIHAQTHGRFATISRGLYIYTCTKKDVIYVTWQWLPSLGYE